MSPDVYKFFVFAFILFGGAGWIWQKFDEANGGHGCGGSILMLIIAIIVGWATWTFFIEEGHHGLNEHVYSDNSSFLCYRASPSELRSIQGLETANG